jgi:hypothetical protein
MLKTGVVAKKRPGTRKPESREDSAQIVMIIEEKDPRLS